MNHVSIPKGCSHLGGNSLANENQKETERIYKDSGHDCNKLMCCYKIKMIRIFTWLFKLPKIVIFSKT